MAYILNVDQHLIKTNVPSFDSLHSWDNVNMFNILIIESKTKYFFLI